MLWRRLRTEDSGTEDFTGYRPEAAFRLIACSSPRSSALSLQSSVLRYLPRLDEDLLRDDADLLRQRPAPHRAHLLDRRDGHGDAVSPPDRREDAVSDGHRRARAE